MSDRARYGRLGGCNASAAGRLYSTGRDMWMSHQAMNISESERKAFLGYPNATVDFFRVPKTERDELVAFVESTTAGIVEG